MRTKSRTGPRTEMRVLLNLDADQVKVLRTIEGWRPGNYARICVEIVIAALALARCSTRSPRWQGLYNNLVHACRKRAPSLIEEDDTEDDEVTFA